MQNAFFEIFCFVIRGKYQNRARFRETAKKASLAKQEWLILTFHGVF